MTIPQRFCGPPQSGNGGYCAGLAARGFEGAVEVTLRRPIPTDRALQLDRDEGAVLSDGSDVLLEVRATKLALDVPPAPPLEAAIVMSRRYPGFTEHPFPTCFVCGPAREAGDGLRIFPGRASAGHLVAAPWVPDHSLADGGDHVRAEFLWAALDCPGYFAIAQNGEAAVLGRITGEVDATVVPGEPCIVVGWPLGRSGRKLQAATAIYDASGTPRGRSLQTWITI